MERSPAGEDAASANNFGASHVDTRRAASAKARISQLPGVAALIVTDAAGALLESTGDLDGEALGAIHVVTTHALARCGTALGLGALLRVTVSGLHRAWLIAIADREVLGIYVDPTKPIGALENALEVALSR